MARCGRGAGRMAPAGAFPRGAGFRILCRMNEQSSTAGPTGPRARDLADPEALLRSLDASERFHRDSVLGGIFHPGAISYRETVPENSLHIVVEGGRLSAHVDRYSPLRFTRDGAARYSFWRIATHNIVGAVRDVVDLLGGPRHEKRWQRTADRVVVDDIVLEGYMDGCLDGSEEVEEALDRLRSKLLARSDETVERASFNLVDEVVHLLDTPEEPWTVQLELRVAGHLDEARLRAALDEALRRHPLSRARKATSDRPANRNYWETRPCLDLDPLRVTEYGDDAALAVARDTLYSTPVPLAQSPPLRAELARRGAGDRLLLNLSHAATDGIGGLRLLRSVARAYTGEPDPLPEVDFLASRDLMGRHAAADVRSRVLRYLAVLERLREVLAPPARIAPLDAREEPGYRIHHLRLSEEETQRLAALPHAGDLTDVLVAALHLAVAAWNARHGSPCRRVTVLLPANLRPTDHPDEMVGNFSVPARVSTTVRQRTSPAATLAAVTKQTSRKQRSGMGTSLLELLSWSWLLPLRVKKIAIDALDQRFTDTALLSDLGRIDDPPSFGDEAGDTVELWFSTPARMPLGVSVGSVVVAERLHLVLRSRRAQFGPHAAEGFVQCYFEQLRRLATQVQGGGQP